ncbi:hypothetical protein IW262DRAFT_1300734 [Armillaria fumosa]|nr:hypothetical protein IW262DRAFT_1300734 [Armillaria fumosa]
MSTVPTGQPIKLPAFDNSLGALYIGSSLATVLYGVICVQTFLYITSNRTRFDSWAMKLLVFILFINSSKTHLNRSGLDTAQQCLMLAGMYRFLISDYANPAALSSEGPSSGLVTKQLLQPPIGLDLLHCFGTIVKKHPTQFFCWRVWTLSATSLNLYIRITIIAISVALAFLNFGLSIFGFRHHFFAVNSPDFTLSWKISASSGIAFDVIMTVAMTLSLYRCRSLGMKRSNHVIIILILLTVNTNLVTTLISIGALVTYLVLPNATIYGGLYLLLSKSYLNSFLAILNSRDFLREKMDHHSQSGQLSIPDFAGPSTSDATSATGEELGLSPTSAIACTLKNRNNWLEGADAVERRPASVVVVKRKAQFRLKFK